MKLGVRFEQRISFWLRAIPSSGLIGLWFQSTQIIRVLVGSECVWMQRSHLQVFTEGQIEMAETQVVDN